MKLVKCLILMMINFAQPSMIINRKFDRIITLAVSFMALAAALEVIFSIGTIDSFAQTDLTTGSTQGEEMNTTAVRVPWRSIFCRARQNHRTKSTCCYTPTPVRIQFHG